MTSTTLQLTKSPAKAESQILRHPEACDDVGLPCAVSVLGDGGEGHADNPLVVKQFGEQIDVQRLYAVVEDNDPIVVMSDFPYRSRHVTSLRKTWVGLNLLECAA